MKTRGSSTEHHIRGGQRAHSFRQREFLQLQCFLPTAALDEERLGLLDSRRPAAPAAPEADDGVGAEAGTGCGTAG